MIEIVLACFPWLGIALKYVYVVNRHRAIMYDRQRQKTYLWTCPPTLRKCLFKYVVRLSLLTMTNPNQLFHVLLFVCSKMADETNLSSKLPVADRTREV